MRDSLLPWAPRSVARGLTVAMAVVVTASTAIRTVVHVTGHDYILGLVPLLYVDKEANIPTFFSVALLLADALALGVIAALERVRGGPFVWSWRILCAGFVLIAADEFMSLHEQLTGPIRRAADGAAGNLFHYGWVAVGIPVVVLVLIAFRRFLSGLPAGTRRQFVIAGVCYVGGAVGLEMIGGVIAASFGDMSVAHSVVSTAEETLEMFGCIIFLRALIEYADAEFAGISVGQSAGASP